MKIVYMGTPEFAVPALEKIIEAGHEVMAVVTQPDKEKDRGKKVQFPPVKEKALQLGIPVLQPKRVRGDEDFFATLKHYDADCFVVAAYGQILPVEVLGLPKYGCVNIHGSLLPRYRGAAPIHRAILDGESATGVTIMYMEEGLDTGDMLSFYHTEIGRKTAALLHDELAEEGAKLLIETLPKIEDGSVVRIKQDDSQSCYAKMLTKSEGLLDFRRTAVELERQVRGLNPWPAAYTFYNGEMVKIWEADVQSESIKFGTVLNDDALGDPQSGTVLNADKNGLAVQTGQGVLLIKKLQFPGKKAMDVQSYLLGNNIKTGGLLANSNE